MPQELELFTVPGFAGVKFAIAMTAGASARMVSS